MVNKLEYRVKKDNIGRNVDMTWNAIRFDEEQKRISQNRNPLNKMKSKIMELIKQGKDCDEIIKVVTDLFPSLANEMSSVKFLDRDGNETTRLAAQIKDKIKMYNSEKIKAEGQEDER